MKNTKRALSILLSLLLVLGAVAVGGMSASAELSQDASLSIGSDTAIFAGDIKKSEGTDWSITVNEDGNGVTLNLDNLDLKNNGICISAEYLDLTITGSAKLTSTTSNSILINKGNLTLNGDFTLRGQKNTGGVLSVDGSLTVEGGSLSVINTGDNDAIVLNGTMTVNGGSVYAKTESSSDRAITTILGLTLNNNEAFAIGDRNAKEVLIKVPGQPPYITGDIIQYGTYPQSKVTDESTLAALNEKISDDGWVSYGYYSSTESEGSMEPSDYMKYQDVILEGVKYRAVMFTAYRPYLTYHPCSADYSYQDDNGYYVSGEGGANVYWFKFEPVEWRVLDPDTGLVLCNSIIDSQAFSNTVFFNGYDPFTDSDLTLFAGDFANSSIRQWLNDDFINTAFSPAQQENIVLSEQPAHYPPGEVDVLIRPNLTLTYTFEPTTEKVFLLTSKDSLNTEYGFSGESGDTALIMSGSDYAESQGLLSDSYYTAWLTRTCNDLYANSVYAFDSKGESCFVPIPDTSAGIVPAMHLTELVSDPTGAPLPDFYPLWVGGNQVTSDNMAALEELDGITVADGGSVTFEPDAGGTGGTLYLNNATITGNSRGDNIYAEDFNLTVEVTGENHLNNAEEKGLYFNCSPDSGYALTVTGGGTLYAEGYIAGIDSRSDLVIDGVTVIAEASYQSAVGIFAEGDLTINNSVVTAVADNFAGLNICGDFTVSGESTVTAIGDISEGALQLEGEMDLKDGCEIIEPCPYSIGINPEDNMAKTVFDSENSVAAKVVIGQPCTVTFNNYDGTELQSGKILKGTAPEYRGETPVKPADGYTYTFSGWDPEITEITEDTVYTATFTDTANKYKITFANEDGTVLQSSEVAWGETPEYKGDTPVKAATGEATYTFKGWSPEIVPVTGEATYTAAFTETKKDKPAKAEITIKGDDALTLNYRQSKTFTADTKGIPEGGKVQWYLNGEKAGEGRTFKVENPEDDYTLQSKVLDKDGNTVAESETVKVTVKHGFFDKLKAWLTDLLLGVFAPLFSKFEEVC